MTAARGDRGDVIAGRFALYDPIARGGSGVVWRAWDLRGGSVCAAKVMRRRDGGELLRFAREQSVRLAHPHVLTPYSWAAEDEHVVIASELVDGGSLSVLMRQHGPLAEQTVARLLDQLLDALGHVHAQGLVHRDVKTANILLRVTGDGPVHCLLADFGLALHRTDARLTEHGMVIGTPGYLAPEMQTGLIAPSAAQDLYGAGQVALALLRGSEPDPAAPWGEPERIADPGLRHAVTALVTADPAGRPGTVDAARQILAAHRADPRPFTAAGHRVVIGSRLEPVGPDFPARTAGPPLPSALAPTGAIGPRGGRHTPSVTPVPTATVSRPRSPRRRVDRRVRRRYVVAGVAAALVLGTGATAGTLAYRAGDRGADGIRVGATCGWQREGDHVDLARGSAVCTREGARYVWRRA